MGETGPDQRQYGEHVWEDKQLEAMIESDSYCNDILTQSAAVSAALNAFNRELLACHIRSCVKRDLLAGDEGVVDELVETVQKLMK